MDMSDDGTDSEDEEDSSEESSEADEDSGKFTSLDNSSTLELASAEEKAEHEFQKEVYASLERAFAEGHSIDNASVELKTLRMASNVPLSRVREAVVAAIVEKINIVDGLAAQVKEIASVIGRWGGLIDRIGGVDAVETLSVLQV